MTKKHVKKKKEDKKAFYMSIFIIAIMVSSAFGVVFYGFTSQSSTLKYNKHKFKTTPLGYELKLEGNIYYFEYMPQDVENMDINTRAVNKLLNSKFIISTSNPNSSYKEQIAISQLNMNRIFMAKDIGIINAFTKENNNLPVLTCENSTEESTVLEFVEVTGTNQTTKIVDEGNCISIEFDTASNLKAVMAKMLYQILGIIEE